MRAHNEYLIKAERKKEKQLPGITSRDRKR